MNSKHFIVVLCLFLLTPTLSFAEDRPYYGVGERDYIGVAGNWGFSKMPSGNWAHWGGPSLVYIMVDHSIAHLFNLDFGFGYNGLDNVTGGYAFTVGPRSGYVHAGLFVDAGYSRYYDDGENGGTVHAANLKAGFIVIGTFWKKFQFFFKIGNSIQIFSSGNFDDPVDWRGVLIGGGVAVNFDPFPLP